MPNLFVSLCFKVVWLPDVLVSSCFKVVELPDLLVSSCFKVVKLPDLLVSSCFKVVELTDFLVSSSFKVVELPDLLVSTSFKTVKLLYPLSMPDANLSSNAATASMIAIAEAFAHSPLVALKLVLGNLVGIGKSTKTTSTAAVLRTVVIYKYWLNDAP